MCRRSERPTEKPMSKVSAWIVAAAAAAAFPFPALARSATAQDSAPAAPAAEDPYDALYKELEQASSAWQERYAAATTDEERQQLFKEYPDTLFLPRFIALAEKHAGTSVALRSLQFVVERGDEDQQLAALATL